MSNTHRKQSRQPKPLTKQQLIDQFTKGMAAHGYKVLAVYGTGRYNPALELSAWPKLDGEDRRIRHSNAQAREIGD